MMLCFERSICAGDVAPPVQSASVNGALSYEHSELAMGTLTRTISLSLTRII